MLVAASGHAGNLVFFGLGWQRRAGIYANYRSGSTRTFFGAACQTLGGSFFGISEAATPDKTPGKEPLLGSRHSAPESIGFITICFKEKYGWGRIEQPKDEAQPPRP